MEFWTENYCNFYKSTLGLTNSGLYWLRINFMCFWEERGSLWPARARGMITVTDYSFKLFYMFNKHMRPVSVVLRKTYKNVNLSFHYKQCKLYAMLSLEEAIPIKQKKKKKKKGHTLKANACDSSNLRPLGFSRMSCVYELLHRHRLINPRLICWPQHNLKFTRISYKHTNTDTHTLPCIIPQSALSLWVCGNNGSWGELRQTSLVLLHINL